MLLPIAMDTRVRKVLQKGAVIPAHPLALNAQRKLDERRQRALTRYYCEAGAGGIAVGVHTTQFAIRDPRVGLLEPVLKLAIETVRDCEAALAKRLMRIAGVCGGAPQALPAGGPAWETGDQAGLLWLGALNGASETKLVTHPPAGFHIIPLFRFYLPP